MPYLYKFSAQTPWTDCATLREGAHQQITGGLSHSVKQDFYSQLAETAINNIGCLLDMNGSAVGFFFPRLSGSIDCRRDPILTHAEFSSAARHTIRRDWILFGMQMIFLTLLCFNYICRSAISRS